MDKRPDSVRRFCGNCKYHDVYQYPDLIFCEFHFVRNEKAVFPTLGCCEFWEPHYQQCFCVEDAFEKRRRTD